MDRIKNPFSPGAGSPPPELAGRDAIFEQADVLLGRVMAQRSEKSILMTGLRGVGKTVLLNEIEQRARNAGYSTVVLEAHEGKTLGETLAPRLRKLLFGLNRLAGAGDKVRRGIAVLKGFFNAITLKFGDVELGLDIDPEPGMADSGDLEVDLPDLFIAVAEAAGERNTAVALFIDEIQYFGTLELSALIMAMHQMQQKQLPLVLIAAGLPILPGLAGDSKSYAERLFSFPDVGPLQDPDAMTALRDPIRAAGASIDDDALSEIVRLTHGYPYFIQEWGYQAWNHAPAPPITLEVVRRATSVVAKRLDENFFRVRFERLTPAEKRFLRAMAELGTGPFRTGDVAEILGVGVTALSPRRAQLIKKGMIYSPAYGDVAFTVPLFNEFMLRAMPAL